MNTQHHTDEDVDLGREEFYDSQGRRITEDYVADAVAEIESTDAPIDEDQAVFAPRGRPSLTRPGTRSPRVDVRVPHNLKVELDRLAHMQGRRESDVVREALEEYLAHH